MSAFLLPIYPTFSSFVNNTTVTEFDRWGIDESTIISSYIWEDNGQQLEWEAVGEWDVFVQSKDSYLQVSAELDEDKKDTTERDDIVEHTVKEDETFASIAELYSIEEKSIYLSNDFHTDYALKVWDVLKLPPVTGMLHTVKNGETLSWLAKEYSIKEEEIMRQNVLLDSADLIVWKTIVIPGAEKEIRKPPAPKPVYTSRTTSSNSGWYSFASQASSQFVNSSGRYKLVWRSPFSGAPGNCTWYVASYKNVNWRGNANQWMRNAAAMGHKTWYNPSVWAIVQFAGSWYNPYYGHVGIVIDVTATHIIVSDMNYRRLYEVTTRKVPIGDRSIQWYIYVN